MTSVLIAAGESSGEKYGADVVREFQRRFPGCRFFGVGGKSMKQAGVEIVFPVEELSAVGIAEVLGRIPHFRRLLSRMREEIDARRPSAALLIDSPDFNLRLAKTLKNSGIPVVYYISPTVWAWREGRLKTIKENVDRMLLIFPFEIDIYRRNGIPAVFVGHPLLQRVAVRLSREEFFSRYGLSSGRRVITLLPGSRKTEVRNHLPVLKDVVRDLKAEIDGQFLLVCAESISPEFLGGFLPRGEESVRILTEDGYDAIAHSDLVLSACGTANLEAALLGTPFIAFYRLSPLTYYPFRPLVKIRHYSIVNILASRAIVPELIQRSFRRSTVVAEARALLQSEEKRTVMREEFRRIRELLGRENAAGNVALELGKVLGLA